MALEPGTLGDREKASGLHIYENKNKFSERKKSAKLARVGKFVSHEVSERCSPYKGNSLKQCVTWLNLPEGQAKIKD